jgi:PIN domain nuclease of toxin-antitoxin system
LIILDTHVWLWWLSEPSLLSKTASREIEKADRVGICSISCFEVAIAVTRGRISIDRGVLDWLETALAQPKIELLHLTPGIAVTASQLGVTFSGDPADRIITATAIMQSAMLVTKDDRIRKYQSVSTVW